VRSSPGLRAFHALLFVGFGASTVAGMLPELRQLTQAWTEPWHSGSPPSLPGTAAALASIALIAALIGFLASGRSAPLWISVALLVAFGVGLWDHDYPVSARSAAGANRVMLEVGSALHQNMQRQLQDHQAVPTTQPEWATALECAAEQRESPFRRPSFQIVPWSIALLHKGGELLPDVPPGTFTVWVPPDASRFTITMTGLDSTHHSTRLRDDQGELVELEGLYAPGVRMK
jgi:hypothetical protein